MRHVKVNSREAQGMARRVGRLGTPRIEGGIEDDARLAGAAIGRDVAPRCVERDRVNGAAHVSAPPATCRDLPFRHSAGRLSTNPETTCRGCNDLPHLPQPYMSGR
jgi:hypothetical protein